METHAARSTSTKEKKSTSPPSRRWFAKRSPSTVLASRNLRRKRRPEGFRPWRGAGDKAPSVGWRVNLRLQRTGQFPGLLGKRPSGAADLGRLAARGGAV